LSEAFKQLCGSCALCPGGRTEGALQKKCEESCGKTNPDKFSILAAALVTLGFLPQILQTYEEAGFRHKLSLQSRYKAVLMLCQGDHKSRF
jgi:hypothetical protein